MARLWPLPIPPPATLLCVRNASASRGYGFDEGRWLGVLASAARSPNPPFEVSVAGKPGPKAAVTLERIFSGLDSETPTVREIEKSNDGKTLRDNEFKATVVSPGRESVFILWKNTLGTWVWLANIDRLRRLAVVTSVYQGITYAGGEFETMDCR